MKRSEIFKDANFQQGMTALWQGLPLEDGQLGKRGYKMLYRKLYWQVLWGCSSPQGIGSENVEQQQKGVSRRRGCGPISQRLGQSCARGLLHFDCGGSVACTVGLPWGLAQP